MPGQPLEAVRIDRRKFVVGASTITMGALGVRAAGASAQTAEVTPIPATIAGPASKGTIDVIPIGTSAPVHIELVPGAKLIRRGQQTTALTDFAVGDVITIDTLTPIASDHVARDRLAGRTLVATAIIPCILGARSEA